MQLGPLKTKCRGCKEHVIVTLEQARTDQSIACPNGHIGKPREVIEPDLVRGVNNGNNEQFEWLVALFDRELRVVIFSKLKEVLPPDIARLETEDALHELYIDIWRKGIGNIEKSLTGYLRRAAHYKAVDICRRRRDTKIKDSDEEPLKNYLARPGLDLDRQMEVRNLFSDGFSQLTDEQREVVQLRWVEERAEQEVADRLSIKKGTVKSRLSRARAVFRKLFENNK